MPYYLYFKALSNHWETCNHLTQLCQTFCDLLLTAAVLEKYQLIVIANLVEVFCLLLLCEPAFHCWDEQYSDYFSINPPDRLEFHYSLQLFADALVKKAYDNWMYVIEYDGKGLFNPKPKKKAASIGQADTNLPAGGPASYQQHLSSVSMPGPSPAGEHRLKL